MRLIVGGPHLLGIGKLAKRSRPAKNQNRQGGKLRRANTALAVAHTQPPEQVNGCGVETVGDRRSVALRQTF
jgi:hypothetical protein